jgi:hypothetical protein
MVVAGLTGLARPAASQSKTYEYTVHAEHTWLDTGLDLHNGDRVHVYGGVIACGGPTPFEKADLPMPSAAGGALLVKLHDRAQPVSAAPDAVFPINEPARLYLGINGLRCSGTLPVKVEVQRGTATK